MAKNILSAKSHWLSEIEGLRGLAIIFVIATHYSINSIPPDYLYWLHPEKKGLPLANMGVMLFFTISAFLLTFLLTKEAELNNNRVNIKNFMLKRFARIWPLYFTAVVISYLFVAPWGPFRLDWYSESYKWHYVNDKMWLFYSFVSNWYLTFREQPNILPAELSVLWSVAVEEQLYLILPVLLAVLFKSKKKAIYTLIALILLALVSRSIFYLMNFININGVTVTDVNKGIYYCSLSYVDVFTLGGIAGYIHAKQAPKIIAIFKQIPVAILIIILAKSTQILGNCLWPPYNINVIYVYGLIGLVFSALIIKTLNEPNSILAKILRNYVLRKIGLISYGVYIWHFLAMDLVNYYMKKYCSISNELHFNICHGILFVCLTISISIVTFVTIEKPLIRYMRKLIQRGNVNSSPSLVTSI